MTLRSLATVAALAVAGVAVPAAAEPNSVSNVVSTAAAAGTARVDATCHFGPVVPDNFEDQMVVTGVATAPGAVSVTIRCTWEDWGGDESDVASATSTLPVAHVNDTVPHWRNAVRVCVSAEANFGRVSGTVVAPKVCARCAASPSPPSPSPRPPHPRRRARQTRSRRTAPGPSPRPASPDR